LWRVVLVSVVFAAMVLGLMFYVLGRGASLETARTLVINAVMAMEVAYLFSVRFLSMRSFTLRGVLGTPAVLAALVVLAVVQLAFTYAPVMNRLFGTAPLTLNDLLLAGGAGVALLLLLEAEKVIVRRLGLFP
jgi:magnesium-transporting ATPase (P-type)